MPSLTQLAHEIAAGVLRVGDFAVDATAGNGHDTVFLARAVGAGGRVVAFDVQAAAVTTTRARLDRIMDESGKSLAERVELVLAGHETMAERLPTDWRRKVGAVFFNLGYLPGGDRAMVTRSETTLRALNTALAWLRTGGVLSVVVYPGHPGGAEEAQAVRQWLAGNSGKAGFSAPELAEICRVEIFGDCEQEAHPWLFVVHVRHEELEEGAKYCDNGAREGDFPVSAIDRSSLLNCAFLDKIKRLANLARFRLYPRSASKALCIGGGMGLPSIQNGWHLSHHNHTLTLMKKFLKTAGLSAVFTVAAALTSQAAVSVATYKYAEIEVDGYLGATAAFDKTSSGSGLSNNGKNYSLFNSEEANKDAAKVGVLVKNKQTNISAYVSTLWVPDSKVDGNDEAGILDAYVQWSTTGSAGTFTVTGGKFLSYFGYESFYIPDMNQITYGLSSIFPGYETGIKLDYTKGALSAGFAVVDSLFSSGTGFNRGDGKFKNVGLALTGAYAFSEKFTLTGVIGYDTGNDEYDSDSDFSLDVFGVYKVNSKFTLGAELSYNNKKFGDIHDEVFAWGLFAKYDITKEFSLLGRVSGAYYNGPDPLGYGVNANANAYQLTIAPAYAFNQHFLIRAEFSWTHLDKEFLGSDSSKDNLFFGAQAVFQF